MSYKCSACDINSVALAFSSKRSLFLRKMILSSSETAWRLQQAELLQNKSIKLTHCSQSRILQFRDAAYLGALPRSGARARMDSPVRQMLHTPRSVRNDARHAPSCVRCVRRCVCGAGRVAQPVTLTPAGTTAGRSVQVPRPSGTVLCGTP